MAVLHFFLVNSSLYIYSILYDCKTYDKKQRFLFAINVTERQHLWRKIGAVNCESFTIVDTLISVSEYSKTNYHVEYSLL